MLALASDVKRITETMTQVESLESLLHMEESPVTTKSIELRNAIKKLMTSSDVQACLRRLQVQGAPAWGLSANERDLIDAARQKVNDC
jgi:hypothetical protein